MVLYDQLVEFAREKQRGSRRKGVHKSVPKPILTVVLGDRQRDSLDALYNQLTGRWSSRLGAMQVCYCYLEAPYTGKCPILQTKLELPANGASGAGVLCGMPEPLRELNAMVTEALNRISREQVAMMEASLAVILPPEDPIQALLSDVAAVFKSRLEDFGVVNCDCRLYLLLPQSYRTGEERQCVCQVMDQMQAADSGVYEQAVLQPQMNAPPRTCRVQHLIDSVMVLDEMNELYQRYNNHGERMTLLVDLIENGWPNMGFLQAVGVQDGTAGPEYWLAQAGDELCGQVLNMGSVGKGNVDMKALCGILTEAAQARVNGGRNSLERALRSCCLYLRGGVRRLAGASLDDGERAVFGTALTNAYRNWREQLPPVSIPASALAMLEEASSGEELERLAGELRGWAEECEKRCTDPATRDCKGFRPPEDETEAANQFLRYLWQAKYSNLNKNEELLSCAELARQCAKSCYEYIERLRTEEEDFAEFCREIQQAWATQCGNYNDGRAVAVKWIGEPPTATALRKAGAQAFRTGDAAAALELIADCVDLNGGGQNKAFQTDPLLCCRIPILIDKETRTQPIEQGISAGRLLKFVVIAGRYTEEAAQGIFMLQKARE